MTNTNDADRAPVHAIVMRRCRHGFEPMLECKICVPPKGAVHLGSKVVFDGKTPHFKMCPETGNDCENFVECLMTQCKDKSA